MRGPQKSKTHYKKTPQKKSVSKEDLVNVRHYISVEYIRITDYRKDLLKRLEQTDIELNELTDLYKTIA